MCCRGWHVGGAERAEFLRQLMSAVTRVRRERQKKLPEAQPQNPVGNCGTVSRESGDASPSVSKFWEDRSSCAQACARLPEFTNRHRELNHVVERKRGPLGPDGVGMRSQLRPCRAYVLIQERTPEPDRDVGADPRPVRRHPGDEPHRRCRFAQAASDIATPSTSNQIST